MSRAFVKETDGTDFAEELPDRPVSPHPNLVTASGLGAIDAEIASLRHALAKAQAAGERGAVARCSRDLRYWSARRATARVVDAPHDPQTVVFGTTVTIERDDGRRQRYRIVGEDEADPAQGSISWVSPLARALSGRGVGDVVEVAGSEVEILGVEATRAAD